VVGKIKDLKLKILHVLGFFNVDDIKETFTKMLSGGEIHAGVLIIPQANSVAIGINNGNLAVFDSHQHGSQGSLVLVCRDGNISELFNYLGEKQDLRGSNFAELVTI